MTRDQQAGGDHVLHRDALFAKGLFQGIAVGRGIAEAEFYLHLRPQIPPAQIGPRLGPHPVLQLALEEAGGQLHHLIEGLAHLRLFFRLACHDRHGNARLLRQPLHRLREETPSVSITKENWSPCLPEEKQW